MQSKHLIDYIFIGLLVLLNWRCLPVSEKESMPPLPNESNTDVEKKINYLSKIIQNNQANAEVFYQRAALNLSIGKENLALADIDRALTLKSDQAEYYYLKALALDQKGDFANALAAARKAQLLEQQEGILPSPTSFQFIGKLYYLQKDTAQARRYLVAAQQAFPDHAEIYYYLGLLGKDAGDSARAVGFLKKAIELQPNYPEVYLSLIDFYKKRGNKRQAIAAAAQAVESCPNQPKLMEIYADLLITNQEREALAIQWYRRAADMWTDNWRLHYIVGMYYYRKQVYREAEKYLKTALANKPNLEKALYSLGMIYEYQQHNLPEALAQYEKAAQITPYDTTVTYSVRRVKRKIAYEEYKKSPQYFLDQMRKRKQEEAAGALEQPDDQD